MQPYGLALREDAAVVLPKKHCAFKGCSWSGSRGGDLAEHLAVKHSKLLDEVAILLPVEPGRDVADDLADRRMSAYSEAIAVVVRRGAPTATYSIDRRCLRNYSEGTSDGKCMGASL